MVKVCFSVPFFFVSLVDSLSSVCPTDILCFAYALFHWKILSIGVVFSWYAHNTFNMQQWQLCVHFKLFIYIFEFLEKFSGKLPAKVKNYIKSDGFLVCLKLFWIKLNQIHWNFVVFFCYACLSVFGVFLGDSQGKIALKLTFKL